MKVYNKKHNESISTELLEVLKIYRKKRDFSANKYIAEKSNLLNRYMRQCHLSSCVVAVSGGVDSAVVLGIVNFASKQKDSPIKRIEAILLPLFNSSGVTNQDSATERGIELCKSLDIEPRVIDINKANEVIKNAVQESLNISGDDWAIGQLGPYSRTPFLYFATSLLTKEGYPSIICGTTNKDEGAYLGYVGKASDGMVDVQIISDIHKYEVYRVANALNIPNSIIEVIPTGDMYDYRSDEMVFGASYDFVELYLNYLKENKIEQEKILKNLSLKSLRQFVFFANNLENLHHYNMHKYASKSPAIHLDLWDSSIPGGWDNYCEIMRKFIEHGNE